MAPPSLFLSHTSLLFLGLSLHLAHAAITPSPSPQSIPSSLSSTYPYSLASSLGLDTYIAYPFPVGPTSNWTDEVLSTASTTSINTRRSTTTSSSVIPTSTAVLRNNATAETPLLTNLTSSYITDYWGLPKGARRVEFGQNDVTFVDDPAGTELVGEEEVNNGTGSQVLRVEYPEGSYSGGTGGTEFVSTLLANSTSPTALLLTYSVYIPSNFDFVLGGKLPGLRAGSDYFSCSGGAEEELGTGCISARIMWRTGGAGEVYGYIPTSTALCGQGDVICNDDYGTSLGRGQFTFEAGGWNELGLYVKLNTGTTTGDGVIQLYFNSALAISFTNLTLSTSSSLSSLSGLFFSTFFGGSDSSWASPEDQYLYFKDVAVWGTAANGSGVADSGTSSGSDSGSGSGSGTGSGSTSAAMMGMGRGALDWQRWGLVLGVTVAMAGLAGVLV